MQPNFKLIGQVIKPKLGIKRLTKFCQLYNQVLLKYLEE